MYYLLIGCNIFMGLVFALRFSTLPPQIPLFFSRPWGEDQLADSWMIMLLPLLMNAMFFINRYLYQKYFPGNTFVKTVFYYLNIGICLGITFIFGRIIFLIT